MKGILTYHKNKKAVSLIIAYVLLVVLAISLSAMVYAWLRWYVEPATELKCEDGTSVIIQDWSYDCVSNKLNVTIQNKGLFSVGGFLISVNDREGAGIGVVSWHNEELELKPGEERNIYADSPPNLGTLTFMDVQAFIYDEDNKIFCDENIATQVLSCSE